MIVETRTYHVECDCCGDRASEPVSNRFDANAVALFQGWLRGPGRLEWFCPDCQHAPFPTRGTGGVKLRIAS